MQRNVVVFAGIALAFGLMGCGPAKKTGPRIGLSLDTLKEERWQRDRDLFCARVKELGGETLVQAANNNDALQNSQAENLITQGVDVLVVVPHNGKTAASIVEAAHKAGVPVIAYDRLINDCDLDLYVSFDNERVGKLQAEAILKRVPTGNYVLIGGAPTDNNAKLFRQGQMDVLEPAIQAGKIRIVADQWAADWSPAEAVKIMENALTQNNNKVDAVVCSNDGLAGGAIQALEGQGLAGKVPISGMDADLSACQRVVKGTQTMTVYKPVQKLAAVAAEWAVKLAQKQPVVTTQTVPNGRINVPAVLLEPFAVDKDNMLTTVVADGFHTKAELGLPDQP